MSIDVITPSYMFYSPQALAKQKEEADKLLMKAKHIEKEKLMKGYVWIKDGPTMRLVSPKRAAQFDSNKLMDNVIKKNNESIK